MQPSLSADTPISPVEKGRNGKRKTPAQVGFAPPNFKAIKPLSVGAFCVSAPTMNKDVRLYLETFSGRQFFQQN